MPIASTFDRAISLPRPARSASRPGLFTRCWLSFAEARQRQVDRDIARMIQAGGGRLTDSLERQIERHLV
jgi:hypothetical protein